MYIDCIYMFVTVFDVVIIVIIVVYYDCIDTHGDVVCKLINVIIAALDKNRRKEADKE